MQMSLEINKLQNDKASLAGDLQAETQKLQKLQADTEADREKLLQQVCQPGIHQVSGCSLCRTH